MEYPTRLTIKIKEGAGGYWRWIAYDQDGVYRCHSRPLDNEFAAIEDSNMVVQGVREARWVDKDGNDLEV